MASATAPGRPVPRLRGHWLLGSMAAVQADFLGAMLQAHRDLGPVVRVDVGPPGWRETIYSVSSPELASELLAAPERWTKDEPGYRELKRMGDGLLTSEGLRWRRQRRMLAPLLTPRRIGASYVPVIVEEAERVGARWRQAAEAGERVDASAEMLELTSRTIGRILFGAQMDPAVPQIMRWTDVNDEMMRRTVSPHPLPLWIPTPANRRFRRGLREMRAVVDGVVAQRRAQGSAATDDMLDLILGARDKDGTRLSDEEVTDQALVFLTAGHDTTATTLACALAELARHPELQQDVRDELDRELGGRRATAEDLPRLAVTGRFVREAMRLWPASHSLGRAPVEDEVLGGYRIPAGSSVIVFSYALHREADVWEDPDTFDPSRFDVTDPDVVRRQRAAWMVLGSGPHSCVGANLTTIETVLVLATILQHVELTTDTTAEAGPLPVHAAITLKPTGEYLLSPR
ncbi:cytochrome P450 [Nocardioides flavescens]|uniref:Cytochrome P450 n=1 Tax=Nocardioides flavescens TaxID=2691959 RepID=A0A6L7F2R1_9ACTN|nr:cytochrome P450 [Nocardioides flavescens]MXG91462.1 cytochrome P450 [Nocardioides flavescens]